MKTMIVGKFKVSAAMDTDGFLRVRVGSTGKREVISINHPASFKNEDGVECFVFTDNQAIVDWEINSSPDSDSRANPDKLRKAGKDKTFRAWWKAEFNETPDEHARRVEALRAKESLPTD